MHNDKKGFLGRIDWVTICLWFTLCLIGWFNIHAAVYDAENPGIFNMATNYGKQSIYIFTALIIGFSILIIDQRFFYFGTALHLFCGHSSSYRSARDRTQCGR
ncbi:hypothetical protein [Sphingobacterium sp. T2]|uniref:hypothetical protein n=1 Tax=Sphingobacterium sp. T2 TaxID=1590596 RepID=UPI000B099694|nr:hypothetical protein [Sphingobacterium sp. T2]